VDDSLVVVKEVNGKVIAKSVLSQEILLQFDEDDFSKVRINNSLRRTLRAAIAALKNRRQMLL
jgi:hypothetical protein